MKSQHNMNLSDNSTSPVDQNNLTSPKDIPLKSDDVILPPPKTTATKESLDYDGGVSDSAAVTEMLPSTKTRRKKVSMTPPAKKKGKQEPDGGLDDDVEASMLIKNFSIPAVTESQADINRWIAERKRKYPTDANMSKQSPTKPATKDLEQDKVSDDKLDRDPIEQPTPVNEVKATESTESESEDSDGVPEEVSAKIPPKPILVKTQICNMFQRNRCKKGDRCQYIHKRTMPPDLSDKKGQQQAKKRKRGDLVEMLADKISDAELECVYEATRYLLQENPYQFMSENETATVTIENEDSNSLSDESGDDTSSCSSSDDGVSDNSE